MDKIAVIKSNRLFENVDVTSLDFSAIKGEAENYEAGKIIYKKKTPAAYLYLVVEGRVTVASEERKIKIDKDEFFGSKALRGGNYDEIAVCEDDAFLIKLSKEETDFLIEQNSQIKKNIESLCFAKDKTNEEEKNGNDCEPCPEVEPCPETETTNANNVLEYEEAAAKFQSAILPYAERALKLISELEEKDDNEKLVEIERELRIIREKGYVAKLFTEKFDEPNIKEIIVSDLVNEFIEHFKIEFPFPECEMEVKSDESLSVEIDDKLFYEAAKQILLNACESVGFSGKIEIEISHDSEYVEIQFSDNGGGIEPEHALDVFEPFVSINKNGLGLGLTVADKIIRTHNGKIAVKQADMSGGVISIFLPIIKNG